MTVFTPSVGKVVAVLDALRFVPSPLADYDRPTYTWHVVEYGTGPHPTPVPGTHRKSYLAAAKKADALNANQTKEQS